MTDEEKMEELGITPLEDILAQAEEYEQELKNSMAVAQTTTVEVHDATAMEQLEKAKHKHANDMQAIHEKSMSIAQAMVDMGMNIDPTKAPRLFEVAAQYMRIALDSANSERDSVNKSIAIKQQQQKIDMDRNKILPSDMPNGGENIVAFEDRNVLLARKKSADAKPE